MFGNFLCTKDWSQVCLSSLKCVVDLTRAWFLFMEQWTNAKYQLPRNCKHVMKSCSFQNQIIFRQLNRVDFEWHLIYADSVFPSCIIMGNLRAGFPSRDLWLFSIRLLTSMKLTYHWSFQRCCCESSARSNDLF